jgi:hypothetical protein
MRSLLVIEVNSSRDISKVIPITCISCFSPDLSAGRKELNQRIIHTCREHDRQESAVVLVRRPGRCFRRHRHNVLAIRVATNTRSSERAVESFENCHHTDESRQKGGLNPTDNICLDYIYYSIFIPSWNHYVQQCTQRLRNTAVHHRFPTIFTFL